MTGELIAELNYTPCPRYVTIPMKWPKLWSMLRVNAGHAARFAAEGRKIGIDVPNNVNAKHWKRLRDAFLRCISERDFIGS